MELSINVMFRAISLLVLITAIRTDDNFKRSISTVKYCHHDSDSESSDSGPCVTHTMAVGSADTLHYVFATHRAPTLLAARTLQPVNITVNWANFLMENASSANSIQFMKDPDTSVALMFTKLIEFDDAYGAANLDYYAAHPNSSWIQAYNFANVKWSNISMNNEEIEFNIMEMERVLPPKRSGSISFKVRIFPSGGFTSELPHLPISANISVIGVTFNNLVTNRTTSRFAVEMVIVTSDNLGKKMGISKRNSFDDSLTPGSFSYTDLVTDVDDESKGVFFQWKPVCYNAASRSIKNSMKTVFYSLTNFSFARNEMFQSGLIYAYFGPKLINATHIQASNLSFGGAKDDHSMFFNATGYTSWTVSMGFGAPPSQQVSLVIILVVSIGLGIPFLLIIVGVIYIVVKRCRSRYEGYSRISGGYEEIS